MMCHCGEETRLKMKELQTTYDKVRHVEDCGLCEHLLINTQHSLFMTCYKFFYFFFGFQLDARAAAEKAIGEIQILLSWMEKPHDY